MSSDPNAPTPAGPDDDITRVHATPTDPFAPPVADDGPVAEERPEGLLPTAEDVTPDSLEEPGAGTPEPAEVPATLGEPDPAEVAAPAASEPPGPVPDPSLSAGSIETTPTVAPAAATPEHPAGTAAPASDWMRPEAGTGSGTPEPDPVVQTPSAFTPLGTPEKETPEAVQKLQAFAETSEGKVALAFVGGVVASFLLKKLGR